MRPTSRRLLIPAQPASQPTTVNAYQRSKFHPAPASDHLSDRQGKSSGWESQAPAFKASSKGKTAASGLPQAFERARIRPYHSLPINYVTHLTLVQSARCLPGKALEEANEMRRLGKAQLVDNRVHVQRGVYQQALGLQYLALLNRLQRSPPGLLAADAVEIDSGYPQLVRIAAYRPVRVIMPLHQRVAPLHRIGVCLGNGGKQRIQIMTAMHHRVAVRLRQHGSAFPLSCCSQLTSGETNVST